MKPSHMSWEEYARWLEDKLERDMRYWRGQYTGLRDAPQGAGEDGGAMAEYREMLAHAEVRNRIEEILRQETHLNAMGRIVLLNRIFDAIAARTLPADPAAEGTEDKT